MPVWQSLLLLFSHSIYNQRVSTIVGDLVWISSVLIKLCLTRLPLPSDLQREDLSSYRCEPPQFFTSVRPSCHSRSYSAASGGRLNLKWDFLLDSSRLLLLLFLFHLIPCLGGNSAAHNKLCCLSRCACQKLKKT